MCVGIPHSTGFYSTCCSPTNQAPSGQGAGASGAPTAADCFDSSFRLWNNTASILDETDMMNRWSTQLAKPPWRHDKLRLAGMILTALVLTSAACARRPQPAHLFAVDQTVPVDGWRVTVHSFVTLPAEQWRQPAQGHVFCAVELTLENTSGSIRYVMPERQMLLVDQDGRTYAPDHDAAVTAARSRQWLQPEGELGIGAKTHGATAYQIPTDTQGLRWVFRSSLLPWAKTTTFALGDSPQP